MSMTDEWDILKRILFSHKEDEMLALVTTRVELKIRVLSEISCTEVCP